MRVAVIGAGIAGTTLARRLADNGHGVEIFEKGRGFGGRLARRVTQAHSYHHGAQFFTARTPAFRKLIADLVEQGLVRQWRPRVVTLGREVERRHRQWSEPQFVGIPGMSSPWRSITGDIPVHLETLVLAIRHEKGQWVLESPDRESGGFDWIVSTAPAEQTSNLLSAELEDVEYEPCFALMTEIESNPGFDAAVVSEAPVAWLAIGEAATQTSGNRALLAHSSGAWASQVFHQDRDRIVRSMEETLMDLGLPTQGDAILHRWRYARVTRCHKAPFWLDTKRRLAACGDWGLGPRVEDGYCSAQRLGDQLLGEL